MIADYSRYESNLSISLLDNCPICIGENYDPSKYDLLCGGCRNSILWAEKS